MMKIYVAIPETPGSKDRDTFYRDANLQGCGFINCQGLAQLI